MLLSPSSGAIDCAAESSTYCTPFKSVRPFMKWPGGKESELALLKNYFPPFVDRFFEPFLGGGAAYFQATANQFVVNDRSEDLVALYRFIQAQDATFFQTISALSELWDSIDVRRSPNVPDLLEMLGDPALAKEFIYRDTGIGLSQLGLPELADQSMYASAVTDGLRRKVKLAQASAHPAGAHIALETAAKSSVYTLVRSAYNSRRLAGEIDPARAACFFFLREFCYSSMFRFSRKNEFNVPFGGHSYCKKSLTNKLELMQSAPVVARMAATQFSCDDFEEALSAHKPKKNDFIFLDPPYDSAFSTYDNNAFGESDQERLARVLKKTKANFMLVVKNTPLMESLYGGAGLHLLTYDMKYSVSFKNRNDRDVEHLMVLNYQPPVEFKVALES